jgi:hypothetical protein
MELTTLPDEQLSVLNLSIQAYRNVLTPESALFPRSSFLLKQIIVERKGSQ